MTPDHTPPTPTPSPTMCVRHPDVETALACGRCETPICPRCLVYTPGGTRCPSCAAIGRPKMYILGPLDYARGIATALVAGVALGFAGALLFRPTPAIGLFTLLFALLGGYGAGIAAAEALNLTMGRKRGREVQAIAAATIVIAVVARFVLAGAPIQFALRDISGLLMAVIGISVASGRLR